MVGPGDGGILYPEVVTTRVKTVPFESKVMYGLPQAGLLAQRRLIAHLAHHGYKQTPTPCLFRHDSNGTVFTLVVTTSG